MGDDRRVSLPIVTERLVLRPFRDEDLDAIVAYRNDPEVARYQDWDGISRDDALFERAELERLEAVTDTRNAPAMALLARLGFTIASTAAATFKGGECLEHTYVLPRSADRVRFPR